MFQNVRRLLEMIRFSHTLFALPFALLSAALAWRSRGRFSWWELLGILLGMVFGRSAAMAFNRIVDRHYDAANPRTAGRHLPSGQVSLTTAITFTVICALGFMASTLIFVWAHDNYLPLILSVPVLVFICAYSFTKRITSLAHFWLGASLLLAPVAAWIAICELQYNFWPPMVVGLAVFFWVSGFDIIYACQDTEFDQRSGLKSIPARVGVAHALRISLICHLIMLALLFTLYFYWISLEPPVGGRVYLTGVGLVALLILYEHRLVTPEDLSRVNQAFFHVNAIISIGLLVIVLMQLAVDW